ncbi:MAG: hypothetical protein M1830_005096, partial [Pleopsidium flavum]
SLADVGLKNNPHLSTTDTFFAGLTMMVPRSFIYSTPLPLRPTRRSEKNGVTITDSALPSKVKAKNESDGRTSKPAKVETDSFAVPSRPVLIPHRAHQEASRRGQRYITGTKSGSKPDNPLDRKHDPDSLPPAVAALLAVTSISPYPKRNSSERRGRDAGGADNRNEDRLLQACNNSSGETESLADFTPSSLDILLSPPEDPDEDIVSIGCHSTTDSVCPVQSLSSESLPSLENDNESTASSSMPPTPRIGTRQISVDRRQRTLSSPQAQDCALDHPLLPKIAAPDALGYAGTTSDTDVLKANIAMPPAPARSSFKSNLTASLRVLRSAARSFSNFTVPVVQRDEYLTQSMLSIQPHFTDDRRPFPTGQLPDPVLRRYLNPFTASPAELPIHSYYSVGGRNESRCTISIQLQTYRRSTKSSKRATSPPVFVSCSLDGREEGAFVSGVACAVAPGTRQREPRENSDFLRIIVMEMNMRREGKLADDAKGKARLWLPPRKPCQKQMVVDGGVPNRWIGFVP